MYRAHNDILRWSVVVQLGFLPFLAVLALGGFLAWSGSSLLYHLSLPDLATAVWQPLRQQYGLALLLIGTMTSTVLALLIAIPIGLGAALYLALYANATIRTIADACIALLGGIPSVIIGLWGMIWIVPAAGNSLSAAALVLALMITPTFTLLAGAALRQAPADLVEAVRALGVNEWGTAGVVLRHAHWGLLGAAILAAARGLGEAVAVSMVAGNVPNWPSLPGPIATLTTMLIVEFDGAAGLHRHALYFLACLVMVLISGISLIGRVMQRRS
ncbi:PstC family ABC transporter permease [Candidatus Entotheonella palauensis]|uniref:ABC transmembrane type-1 domain-containing protein n=1 Tax=Candidatus Entotheonella gemina TaxID=1429439 RepID=W4M4K4_9BACT|nr:ABC transporter permease subunit [Candidatus Entotheonella palauensis]ETX05130.1 MAG: hypothetical protein ETSY2_24780 [Candidatus Entotheonella gemina]